MALVFFIRFVFTCLVIYTYVNISKFKMFAETIWRIR